MTTSEHATARSSALEHISRVESVLEGWRARLRDGRRSMAEVQAHGGADAFDDPMAADRVHAELQRLAAEIDIAGRAVVAGEGRVVEAKVAVLELDRDELAARAVECREALAAHQVKTEKLLSQLRRHEGEFVSLRWHVIQMPRDHWAVDPEPPVMPSTRSSSLELEAQRLEFQAGIVEDVITGVDPELRIVAAASVIDGTVLGLSRDDIYPSCVAGPEAIVLAPRFVKRQPQGGLT